MDNNIIYSESQIIPIFIQLYKIMWKFIENNGRGSIAMGTCSLK